MPRIFLALSVFHISNTLRNTAPTLCSFPIPCSDDALCEIRLGFGSQVGYFHGYVDGVDWVFVDHPSFHHFEHEIYGGSRTDILFRCALLCKAALEAPWHVPCGGSPYGDSNLLYIANDWHTALLPFYLQVLLHRCCVCCVQ